MATPPIFAKRNKAFSADQFDEFINFYVIELEKIVRKGHQNKVNVFFIPSSIAIEMPNFQVPEYARAKEESEKLCRKLSKELNVHIINPRLPALKTDQTNGISQKPNADILGHLTLSSNKCCRRSKAVIMRSNKKMSGLLDGTNTNQLNAKKLEEIFGELEKSVT